MKMKVFLVVLLGICGVVAVGCTFMSIGALLEAVGAWKIAVSAAVAAGLMVIGFSGADKKADKKKSVTEKKVAPTAITLKEEE